MKQGHLTIGAVSRQTGLTERALRLYEAEGLLKPGRTAAGRRRYGPADLARLHQVLVLREAGFSLAAIAGMLGQKRLSPGEVLGMQAEMLKGRHDSLSRALAKVEAAIKIAGSEASLDIATFCQLIKLTGEKPMENEDWHRVFDKFYTPEEQARWIAAKSAVPEEDQREAEQRWPLLIARGEALLGRPASDPDVLALAEEWQAMMQPLLSFDPALAQSAGRLYDRMDQWPEGTKPPFSAELWQLMKAAGQILRERKAA